MKRLIRKSLVTRVERKELISYGEFYKPNQQLRTPVIFIAMNVWDPLHRIVLEKSR